MRLVPGVAVVMFVLSVSACAPQPSAPPLPSASDIAGCYDTDDVDVELVAFDLGIPGVEGGIVGDGWNSTDGTCTDGGFGSNKLWVIATDIGDAAAKCDAVTGVPGSPVIGADPGSNYPPEYVFICG